METNGKPRITKSPEICGGRACIAGHRIRVMDIVVCHDKHSMSPEEIISQYPGITLADVYAAMAYFFENRQEIEASFQQDNDWSKWLTANIPSKTQERLRG